MSSHSVLSHSLPLMCGSSASQCSDQDKIQRVVRREESVPSTLPIGGLGVIPFNAVIAMRVNQKVIQSRVIQRVIRLVIKVITTRNQREVRSEKNQIKVRSNRNQRK
eukprot:2330878-Amphidinium_carterae.2